jgi:YVTN family beta-propeller protein
VRKRAYVGHYGIETSSHLGDVGGHAVFVIDLEAQAHIATLDIWPFYRPHGLALDAEGRLFVMSEAHNTLLRFSDPVNRHVPDLAVPSGGYKTHLFALTRDGQTAYALNLLSSTVTKIRPNDPTFAPVAMVPGPVPEGNALSADERLLYVANRGDDTIVAIDTASMKLVASGKTRRDPTRVYRSADAEGRELLLATHSGEQSLSVFGTDLKEQRCIALPANPLALSLHPNGRSAWGTCRAAAIRCFRSCRSCSAITGWPGTAARKASCARGSRSSVGGAACSRAIFRWPACASASNRWCAASGACSERFRTNSGRP